MFRTDSPGVFYFSPWILLLLDVLASTDAFDAGLLPPTAVVATSTPCPMAVEILGLLLPAQTTPTSRGAMVPLTRPTDVFPAPADALEAIDSFVPKH